MAPKHWETSVWSFKMQLFLQERQMAWPVFGFNTFLHNFIVVENVVENCCWKIINVVEKCCQEWKCCRKNVVEKIESCRESWKCCWKCCRKMLLEIKNVVETGKLLLKNVVETWKSCRDLMLLKSDMQPRYPNWLSFGTLRQFARKGGLGRLLAAP